AASEQNRSNPPPDPIESIEYSGPPSSIHRVRMAVDRGNTVDDPAMLTSTEGSTSMGSMRGSPHCDVSAESVGSSAGSVDVEATVSAAVSSAWPMVVVGAAGTRHAAKRSERAATAAMDRRRIRSCLLVSGSSIRQGRDGACPESEPRVNG